MKKLSIFVVLTIVCSLLWIAPAMAKDEQITGRIDQIVEGTTSTNQPYLRMIVTFDKKTNSGVVYSDSLPFMVFQKLVPEGKAYKAGQMITVVAKSRFFEGRQSYTVLKFVKSEPQAKQ
jgi:hypothetical protein